MKVHGIIMMCPLLLLMYNVGFGGVFSYWSGGGPANWIQKSGLRSDRHIFKSNMAHKLLTHVVIGPFLFIFCW